MQDHEHEEHQRDDQPNDVARAAAVPQLRSRTERPAEPMDTRSRGRDSAGTSPAGVFVIFRFLSDPAGWSRVSSGFGMTGPEAGYSHLMADAEGPDEEQDALTRFAEMVRGMRFSMLTTVAADGSLRSRPMSTQDQSADGTLWFLVAADSGAAEDLGSRSDVNLAFSSPDEQRWVSVSGSASIGDDRARILELWNPLYEAWFPAGPEDPNVRVVRVVVGDIHHWDATSSRMLQLRAR